MCDHFKAEESDSILFLDGTTPSGTYYCLRDNTLILVKEEMTGAEAKNSCIALDAIVMTLDVEWMMEFVRNTISRGK